MLKNENDMLLNKSMSLNEYINRIENVINQNKQSIENEDERIIKAAQEILKTYPENTNEFLNHLYKIIQNWINEAIPKEAILTLEDYDHYFNYAISNRDPNQESINKIINELETKLDSMTNEELEAYLKELGFLQETMPDNIKEHAQRNKKIVKTKKNI